MINYFLIFPIHLFINIKLLINKKIYLIEDERFFVDFKYHKLKIAYHRATMKSYYDYLKSHKLDVKYIEFNDNIKEIYKDISKYNVYCYSPNDNILKDKLLKYIHHIHILDTPNFLINEELIKNNIDKFYQKGKYNHQNFYKWQRTRLNILMDENGKPVGGKWSFDTENRKKLPKDIKIPNILEIKEDKYIKEAKIYVEKYFKDNYGSLDHFIYPINHHDSKMWLIDFLKNRFHHFGVYEDAEDENHPFLFHSILSPMMNIGILTDTEVIDITLTYQKNIPIASFEGFIRQIIGWRNYVYTIYLLEGDNQRKMNFFDNKNTIKKNIMWEGKTDILPIDNIINKINKYAYAHHIERLMYLGNYMLISMVHPNDVYQLFMEWTIDAYEWVMIPNVYGMSQFADGGIMMTRPYFSSSNYILKMSNYKKNEKWCKIYDALYYNFINHHQKYLSTNYATSRQVAFWKKKNENDKKNILKIAKDYLKNYFE